MAGNAGHVGGHGIVKSVSPAEEMKLFDALPVELRGAIAEAGLEWSSGTFHAALCQGYPPDALRRQLIDTELARGWATPQRRRRY